MKQSEVIRSMISQLEYAYELQVENEKNGEVGQDKSYVRNSKGVIVHETMKQIGRTAFNLSHNL